MKLYHGSTMTVRHPSIMRSRPNTDFGKGFYTTTNFDQAAKWARIKQSRDNSNGEVRAVVSIYEFDESILSGNGLNIMHFSGANKEWLDFVVDNRRGGQMHDYDMVMGPVADDKLYATITLYENGTLDVEAAITQLKTHTLFDQLSFHTAISCGLLTFVGATVLPDA